MALAIGIAAEAWRHPARATERLQATWSDTHLFEAVCHALSRAVCLMPYEACGRIVRFCLEGMVESMIYAALTKYFRGGNMPRRSSSFPTRRRTSSDQFTQPCSLKPRKWRAFSYGAMPR